jgi:hypothetical protein
MKTATIHNRYEAMVEAIFIFEEALNEAGYYSR